MESSDKVRRIEGNPPLANQENLEKKVSKNIEKET